MEVISPDGGAVVSSGRTFFELANGKRTIGLTFRFRQTVTVAVAALTNLRNRGSTLSQFTKIGVNDNGRDVVNIDARSAGIIGQVHAGQVLPSTRLDTPIAVYSLEETVYLPLGNPLSVSPWETAFSERNPNTRLRAFVTWVPDATLIANNAGGSTLTLATPTVEVIQHYDDDRGAVPSKLSPFWREIVQPVATANNTLRTLFDSSLRLRGILVQQDSNIGEVTDIYAAASGDGFRFLGDRRIFIGPQVIPYVNLQRKYVGEYGGDMAAASGYLYINLQRSGRLAEVVNQAQNANLRFESQARPSVTAGVTSSNLRLTLLELEEIPGLTLPPERWGFIA
jgi:hypothetical protein